MYKVLRNLDKHGLVSPVQEGYLRFRYSTEHVSEDKNGLGLFVFDNLESAKDFIRCYFCYVNNVEIWSVECTEELDLPYFDSLSFPEGTKVYRKVRLIRKVDYYHV